MNSDPIKVDSEPVASERPKRLLSLDGGGLRGLISAEVLIRIEEILKKLDPKITCLADYFDFISGTSTGSILAAGLAKGRSATFLRNFYYDNATKIFQQRFFLCQFWSKYKSEPLEQALQNEFGDMTLGSPEIKPLLMIVTKNATSGSTWFFVNNKKNPFYETNSKVSLWHIVRSSSAAPTYFSPHQFLVGDRPYEFIDGGMSPYNNSSFQQFLEATQSDYQVNWPTGVKNLLQISIGTGYSTQRIPAGKAENYTLLNWAPYSVGVLMNDSNLQQNLLMELIGEKPPRSSKATQSMLQELPKLVRPQMKVAQDLGANIEKQLTYRRYTTSFTLERLQQLQQVDGLSNAERAILAKTNPADVEPMDCVDQVDALSAIGRAIALEQVSEDLFREFLGRNAQPNLG